MEWNKDILKVLLRPIYVYNVYVKLIHLILYIALILYILFFQPEQISVMIALFIAIICHEVAHGYAALYLGDPTAKQLGRLTLNPLAHVDFVGSLVVPALLIISNVGFVFGWAKPVPVSMNRLKQPYKHMMYVALAGPIVNIILMSIFICLYIVTLKLIISVFPGMDISLYTQQLLLDFLIYSMLINLVFACFNMIPIPPLDGSHVLTYFLPPSLRAQYNQLKPYGFIILILLLSTNVIRSYLITCIRFVSVRIDHLAHYFLN